MFAFTALPEWLVEIIRQNHAFEKFIVFLHKIMAGPTDQSFGIHVAKIAGIPKAVIERSKEILLNLEKKELNRLVKERITGRIQKASPPFNFFRLWQNCKQRRMTAHKLFYLISFS